VYKLLSVARLGSKQSVVIRGPCPKDENHRPSIKIEVKNQYDSILAILKTANKTPVLQGAACNELIQLTKNPQPILHGWGCLGVLAVVSVRSLILGCFWDSTQEMEVVQRIAYLDFMPGCCSGLFRDSTRYVSLRARTHGCIPTEVLGTSTQNSANCIEVYRWFLRTFHKSEPMSAERLRISDWNTI